MDAWGRKRERPCPHLDHARSLDQSRGSSERYREAIPSGVEVRHREVGLLSPQDFPEPQR
jgi:hypothetical protein